MSVDCGWLAVFLLISWNIAQAAQWEKIAGQVENEDLKRSCQEGSRVVNKCEERCECRNGKLVNCYRVRKDFLKMDINERRHFLNTYRIASMHPAFRKDYRKVVAYHVYTPEKLLHDTPYIFLPWHRWWLIQFENHLRRIDCRVTAPYWNWSRVAHHWWKASGNKDFWNPGDHGYGSDGSQSDLCVENGPFSKDKWVLLDIIGGGCLQRNFSFTNLTGDEEHVKRTLDLPLEKFFEFEAIIRTVYHNELHWYVGGTMYGSRSANAPELVPHHSFLDKIWHQWQKKGEDYKNVFFPNVHGKFPLLNYYGWQWLDLRNLPGELKVMYDDEPWDI